AREPGSWAESPGRSARTRTSPAGRAWSRSGRNARPRRVSRAPGRPPGAAANEECLAPAWGGEERWYRGDKPRPLRPSDGAVRFPGEAAPVRGGAMETVTRTEERPAALAPRYDPAEVEARWTERWAREPFTADPHSDKPPFCIVIP